MFVQVIDSTTEKRGHVTQDAHRVHITIGTRTYTIRPNDRTDHPDAIIIDCGLGVLTVTPGASNYIRVRQD